MKKLFSRTKTVYDRQKFIKGSRKYDLYKQAKETLGGGDLKKAVLLPQDQNVNDWIAVHVVDFRNKLNLFHGLVQEQCTEETCPIMNAGPQWEYHWVTKKKQKPQKLSAPEYISKLIEWVDHQIDDPRYFPEETNKYPRSWKNKICKPIFRRLFRILGHIYYNHFATIREKGAEAHLNTLLIHFVYFARQFSLMEQKDYLPMKELIVRFCQN
ncbi:mob kinase activator-like 1 [Anaeramoeba flamelloides]|uniref:Mob kinase activator-like 1 n=1 Tax=Anaeramoeba flamelloides TaxID=1746091 RepID=A0ABQ8Y7G9_9EUKA|nr:mob kinase activator-like 1 [Anaeramoeba flamelloides]